MAVKYSVDAAEAVIVRDLTSTTTGGILTTASVQARILDAAEAVVPGSEITLAHDPLRPGTYLGVIPPLNLSRDARYWLDVTITLDGVRVAHDRVELVAGHGDPSPVDT